MIVAAAMLSDIRVFVVPLAVSIYSLLAIIIVYSY